MPLEGILLSRYQTDITINADIPVDFVIIKITGGGNDIDQTVKTSIEVALKAGKLVGLYHLAQEWGYEGFDVMDEVVTFLDVVKPYLGKIILILGVELDNFAWTGLAKKWLNLVTNKTGVKPLVCMSANTEGKYDWSEVVKAGYKLWLVDLDYVPGSTKHWARPIILQYSSIREVAGFGGKVDKIRFFGLRTDWEELTGLSNCEGRMADSVARKGNDRWLHCTIINRRTMETYTETEEDSAFKTVSLHDNRKLVHPQNKETSSGRGRSNSCSMGPKGKNIASDVDVRQGICRSQSSKISRRGSRSESSCKMTPSRKNIVSDVAGPFKTRRPYHLKDNDLSTARSESCNEVASRENIAARLHGTLKLYHPKDNAPSVKTSKIQRSPNEENIASYIVGLRKRCLNQEVPNQSPPCSCTSMAKTHEDTVAAQGTFFAPDNTRATLKESHLEVCTYVVQKDTDSEIARLVDDLPPSSCTSMPITHEDTVAAQGTFLVPDNKASLEASHPKCTNVVQKGKDTDSRIAMFLPPSSYASMVTTHEDTVAAQGLLFAPDNTKATLKASHPEVCTNVVQKGKDTDFGIAMLLPPSSCASMEKTDEDTVAAQGKFFAPDNTKSTLKASHLEVCANVVQKGTDADSGIAMLVDRLQKLCIDPDNRLAQEVPPRDEHDVIE